MSRWHDVVSQCHLYCDGLQKLGSFLVFKPDPLPPRLRSGVGVRDYDAIELRRCSVLSYRVTLEVQKNNTNVSETVGTKLQQNDKRAEGALNLETAK